MREFPLILLVDDDESLRRVTRYHLEQEGYRVREAASGESALSQVEDEVPDLVITDVKMPGMDGLQLLGRLKARWPELGVVVITAHGSIEAAVQAMRQGAHDYVVKPFDHQALLLSIQKGLRLNELMAENRRLSALAGDRLRFDALVATSGAMTALLEQAQQVARRDTTALLLGESGTGKELLARAIHHASPRRDGPFVAVNVGALPESLIDSELFGHVKGAFTGADHSRPGRFQQASGGTLFLDEIGELRPELQVKLLRVLQEGEVDPVGATEPVRVDARVIAATHRDLEAMVKAGEFREDLFYRLYVVPLELPPLRARKDDIPPLVRHLLKKHAQGEPPAVDAEALAALQRYDWPGNVRELENVLERAVVLNPTGPLGEADLPERVRRYEPQTSGVLGELPEGGLDLEALEKELLARALEKCGGNQSAAARYLNITRNTLLYRLEKHGLR